MRFLCLAYGAEADWIALPEERRQELLAGDDMLRRRGATIAVLGEPTVVRAWDGTPHTAPGPFATAPAPLVGFSIIEADDVQEAVRLVSATPCAGARGAVEVRPMHDPASER